MSIYTEKGKTITGASKADSQFQRDAELGRQTRKNAEYSQVANVVGKQAYDKGRYDTEASLADMLYKQVFAPQGTDANVPAAGVGMTPEQMLEARDNQFGGDISPMREPTAEELGLAGALR